MKKEIKFQKKKYVIASMTTIGHIHLSVKDLAVSVHFYRDILGFEVMQDNGSAVFLSAGGYHHTIGLNTWNDEGARSPQEGQIGLYHFAILYPSRKDLANALKSLIINKYPLGGASDHGVSESIYLEDPDGNGIELYWDKPKSEWPIDKNGKLMMYTKVLEVKKLLSEAEI